VHKMTPSKGWVQGATPSKVVELSITYCLSPR
jgi:hypothetical protein